MVVTWACGRRSAPVEMWGIIPWAQICAGGRSKVNTLHAARHAYVKSESDERIRRALRHPVRVSEVEFNQGDKVFYKRDDSNRWRGPGSIIGVDGKVAFIKHGSRLVRVSKW